MQPELFDQPSAPLTPWSDTRRLAREASGRIASLTCCRIVELLRAAPSGLTADEIAERLGRSPFSIRPRVTELRRARFITDTGQRRRARQGRGSPQRVFVIANPAPTFAGA